MNRETPMSLESTDNAFDVESIFRRTRDRIAELSPTDHPARVSRPLIKELSRMGLMAPFFDTTYGGTGNGQVNATLLCGIREALARTSAEASTALATQIGGIFVAARHASPEVRQEWVPLVVSGDAVTAIALTEPERGNDVASMTMAATREPGGWRLSGKKVWIMKAPEADIYTVFARTSGQGARGITAFLVPRDSQGLTGEPIDSLWPDRVGNLYFDGVFVPDGRVVGPVDEGYKLGMAVFDAFRPSVAAHMVGLAQPALDLAVRYAKTRRAFGQPIGQYQAVSHLLANMQTRLQAARLLTSDAASTYDRGDSARIASASAMAKLYATEMAQFVVDGAIQVHGAVALERGHLLEHLYREVRPSRIYEGTSEIQREIIARSLFRRADTEGAT